MKPRFEKVLIDGWEGVYEDEWELSSDNLIGIKTPAWSIRKYTLRGGKQHGVDVVELDNGEMTVVVVPTRGMNVLSAYTDDVDIGWDSPVKQVVHPAYVNGESRGGLGWLEGFNELVARCGLESQGAPGEDVIKDEDGKEVSRQFLPLHGRISNTPAVRVWVSVGLAEPHALSVSGEVYDTRLFGPSHKLLSTVSTLPGSAAFRIEDTVQNLCSTPREMELLYHCNLGPPLLEEGSSVIAPVEKMCARDAEALKGLDHWDAYEAPEAGFAEQVYYFTLHGDEDDRTAVALANAAGDLGLSLRFSTAQLPAFALWKNTDAERDGYVTGLEPGTDYPNPRQFEREKGRVVELGGGEIYRSALEFELLRGASRVSSVRDEIDRLMAGKDSTISSDIDPDLSPAG